MNTMLQDGLRYQDFHFDSIFRQSNGVNNKPVSYCYADQIRVLIEREQITG
jgi:hypothetical protein